MALPPGKLICHGEVSMRESNVFIPVWGPVWVQCLSMSYLPPNIKTMEEEETKEN